MIALHAEYDGTYLHITVFIIEHRGGHVKYYQKRTMFTLGQTVFMLESISQI